MEGSHKFSPHDQGHKNDSHAEWTLLTNEWSMQVGLWISASLHLWLCLGWDWQTHMVECHVDHVAWCHVQCGSVWCHTVVLRLCPAQMMCQWHVSDASRQHSHEHRQTTHWLPWNFQWSNRCSRTWQPWATDGFQMCADNGQTSTCRSHMLTRHHVFHNGAWPVLQQSSQYSLSGSKNVHCCVCSTLHCGIIFWQSKTRNNPPFVAPPQLPHDSYKSQAHNHQVNLPTACADSNWVGNIKNCKLVTGCTVHIAGRPIHKSWLQPTVALSSTEAEFIATNDAEKIILCVCSILNELRMNTDEATDMFIDNAGAHLMGNSHKPTKQTRHLATKHFALLEWTDWDLIVLKLISAHDDNSDALTKALGKQLFNHHKVALMGYKPPQCDTHPTQSHVSNTVFHFNHILNMGRAQTLQHLMSWWAPW